MLKLQRTVLLKNNLPMGPFMKGPDEADFFVGRVAVLKIEFCYRNHDVHGGVLDRR